MHQLTDRLYTNNITTTKSKGMESFWNTDPFWGQALMHSNCKPLQLWGQESVLSHLSEELTTRIHGASCIAPTSCNTSSQIASNSIAATHNSILNKSPLSQGAQLWAMAMMNVHSPCYLVQLHPRIISRRLPCIVQPRSFTAAQGLWRTICAPDSSTTRRALSSSDVATTEVSNGIENEAIPVLSLSEVAERLQGLAKTRPEAFRAMYSSAVGGITTDPAAMVIPMDDHIVHRGHGVFDTAIISNGFLYELDAHLDRLLRSAKLAKIKSPFDRATLRHILLQTVAASGCREGSLRYWLSAGLGGFGLSSQECFISTFYAMVVDNTYKGPEGVKVITATVPIKPQLFATVKSVNYLPNVLVQLEAEEQGAFTAIWLDNEGFLAEGPNMNVALVSKEGFLLVPSFDNVLAGCTVRRMLELVESQLIPGLKGAKVHKISVHEARAASEMVLVGSGVLVKPVVEWDGVPVGTGNVGPVSSALREAMEIDIMDLSSGKLVAVPYADSLHK